MFSWSKSFWIKKQFYYGHDKGFIVVGFSDSFFIQFLGSLIFGRPIVKDTHQIESDRCFWKGFESGEKRKLKKKNQCKWCKNESSLPYRGADGLAAVKSCLESSFIILYKCFFPFFSQFLSISIDMIGWIISCTFMIESRSSIAFC